MKNSYERNNRSNQMKALRCFPLCKSTGHSAVGFCGSSLKTILEVTISPKSPACQHYDTFWMQTVYIAELRCKDDAGLSAVRYVPKHEVMSNLRTKTEKFKPYIKGECVGVETIPGDGFTRKKISLEFNAEHNAWHYGWISHKYSNSKSHVIDVMVLVERAAIDDRFFIAASFLPPEFTIVSTKRGRATKRIKSDKKVVSKEVPAFAPFDDAPITKKGALSAMEPRPSNNEICEAALSNFQCISDIMDKCMV